MPGSIVGLAHFSVKEYLLAQSDRALDCGAGVFCLKDANAHTELATRCLDYLSLGAFSTSTSSTKDNVKARLKAYPLLHYTSIFWVQALSIWC